MSLNERLHSLSLQVYIGQVENESLELSSRLESKAHAIEKQSLLDIHKKELQSMKSELSKIKVHLKSLLSKFERLKKILIGYHM